MRIASGDKILAGLALAAWTSVSAAYAADAPSLSLGLRLQGWYVAEQHGAPNGGTAQDFLLRRGYLSATGKLSSTVSAFVHVAGDRIGQAGLDAPGLGLGSGLALRDGWVAWAPHPAFHVQAGRMYVPFTRTFGTESTFTLLTLDLPQTQGGGRGALFYPSKVGRDDGIVVWGGPWRGRLQYRLGVMEGVEGQANPADSLRLSGRLSVHLLEPEADWFNRGTHLGEKRVLALGIGIDRQADLVLGETGKHTYRAWTVDLFLDHPLGRGTFTVEASYSDAHGLPQGLPFAGVPVGAAARMVYLQGGYVLPWRLDPGRVQVYGRAERVLVTGGGDASLPSAGLNYLIRGHDLKLTADWSRAPRGARPASDALTLQAQIGF
jgi:hypothetical protein